MWGAAGAGGSGGLGFARWLASRLQTRSHQSLANLLVPSLLHNTKPFFPTPILAYTATKDDFFRMNHIDALFHSLDIRRFEKQFLNGNPG